MNPTATLYLELQNYVDNNPKNVLKQVSILTKTIHDQADAKEGAIKHYIETYGSVPLWVLANYLTIGNMSHLYNVLKNTEKNIILPSTILISMQNNIGQLVLLELKLKICNLL